MADVPSGPLDLPGGAEVRVGTAGWTDKTLTAAGVFYPPGADMAEDRLRYYASRFSMVEIDSTYYSLPAHKNAELWAERTPPGFIFDVKAHALMTGQPTEVDRLPGVLRGALPLEVAEKKRIYGKDLPRKVYDRVWDLFKEALGPLRDAGKMGSILLQYPRWLGPSESNRDLILEAKQRLEGWSCAVEFRNSDWFAGGARDLTLQFLQEHDLPFVMVDGPQGTRSSVPPIVAVTSPDLALVRFHGRRTETWEKPGVGVDERFRYLYSPDQLSEWHPRIMDAAGQARQIHVVMNNCHSNYGTTNALEFVRMLQEPLPGFQYG